MFFIVELIINWMLLTVYFTLIDNFVPAINATPVGFWTKLGSGLMLLFFMVPYTKYYASKIIGDDDANER